MSYDVALLVLRVVVGLVVALHGAQKLFGWFGGSGLTGWRGAITHMRMRPVGLWTYAGALAEFGGGVLLGLGLLNSLGALGVVGAMAMAILLAHWPRFFTTEGGMEFPLVLLVVGVVLGLTGPGRYSLDAALGLSLPEPTTFVVGLVLVVLSVIGAFATRAPEQAAQQVASEA